MSLRNLDSLKSSKSYLTLYDPGDEDLFWFRNFRTVKLFGIEYIKELDQRKNLFYYYPRIYMRDKPLEKIVNRRIPDCYDVSETVVYDEFIETRIDETNNYYYENRITVEALPSEERNIWVPLYEPDLIEGEIPLCYISWNLDGKRRLTQIHDQNAGVYTVLHKDVAYDIDLSNVMQYKFETVLYIPDHIKFKKCFNFD